MAPVPSIWAFAWGNSPENAKVTAENGAGTEETYRFFFYPTVAGTMERLHFSNYFGTTAVTIGVARLARAATPPAIDPNNDAAITFGGSSSVVIAPGATVVSDPVQVSYDFGQKMAVTMYVQGSWASLSQHDSQVGVNYSTAAGAGNTSADSSGSSFTAPVTEWYLLSGMEVYGAYQGTVALFGSSTIDGHASNYGNTNSYPVANTPIPSLDNDRPSDWLARQLHAAGYNVGVLNAGVIGDGAGPAGGSVGTPGVDRIGRDVLQLPGINTVVISLGSVDLRGLGCGYATDVEGYLTNMVSQAYAAGVRVILATVSPASYCIDPNSPNYGPVPTPADPYAGDINPGPENPGNAQRHILNAWIRSAGAQLPGVYGIADFETALADPDHPDFLIPSVNSGDNFHPNGPGYALETGAIPLASLLAK